MSGCNTNRSLSTSPFNTANTGAKPVTSQPAEAKKPNPRITNNSFYGRREPGPLSSPFHMFGWGIGKLVKSYK